MPTTIDTSKQLKDCVLKRMAAVSEKVWIPADFLDLASREAVDKVLQRLATAGSIRRIERGLYDIPRQNPLTGRPSAPDYRAVIEAVARRDQARFLIDGMTAANELGLTTAIPAKIEVLVDARLRPIKLGNQEIHFRQAAASRLFWAERPAMRLVQALYWLQDILENPSERGALLGRISCLLSEPPHGPSIRADLKDAFSALPIWMQTLVRPLLAEPTKRGAESGELL
jgi:predicted transcriptional regulator of viral defense system